MNQKDTRLRALCVARHAYLSAHFASLFSELDLETKGARGLDEALLLSKVFEPDVVICEYELLMALPTDVLERDALLSKKPLIAVSLTRRAQEAQLMHMRGVSAFLYLPNLERGAATRAISSAVSNNGPSYIPSSLSTASMEEVETTS